MQSKVRHEQQQAVNFLARLGRTTSETHELLTTAYQQDALRKPATRAYLRRFQTLGVDLYRGSPRSKRSKTRAKKIGVVSPAQKVNDTTEKEESKSKILFTTNIEAESVCANNMHTPSSDTAKDRTESQKEIINEQSADIDHKINLSKKMVCTTEGVSVDNENTDDEDTDIEDDNDTFILNDDISNYQGDIANEYHNETVGSKEDELDDQILSHIDNYNENFQYSERFDFHHKLIENIDTTENINVKSSLLDSNPITNKTEHMGDDISKIDNDLHGNIIEENQDDIEVGHNIDLDPSYSGNGCECGLNL